MRLSELKKDTLAHVVGVESVDAGDAISRRLRDLGFVHGEAVRIVATGPFGADPLLVRIGHTRFALRRTEAARVRIAVAGEATP